jgi:hypothetical protein
VITKWCGVVRKGFTVESEIRVRISMAFTKRKADTILYATETELSYVFFGPVIFKRRLEVENHWQGCLIR